jgi:hypothetical protein
MMSGFGLDGSALPLYPMIAYEVGEIGGWKAAIFIDPVEK